MAGFVCTIAGGNGGVGKTTTVINVSTVLQQRGHDVAVVDADLGMPNVAEMLDVEVDECLHDVLAGETIVSDTLTGGPAGLTIVPGQPSLEAYADADATKLRKVLRTLRKAYDVVVVDTSAGLSQETTVPMEMAEGVVLTTTPDHVSLTDTGKTGKIANLVESDIIGTLIVRSTEDTPLSEIDANFEFPVLGGIPHDPDAAGDEPLVLESPESKAARAYRELTTELERVFFEGARGAELELVF